LRLIEDGKEAPPQFYDQPEIMPGSQFYWDAFGDLGSDRQFGMGIGPIPYSAIRRYADSWDIVSRDEFAFFYGIIRSLDAEYMKLANAPKDKNKAEMVPISDVENQHLLFDRLRTRANAAGKRNK